MSIPLVDLADIEHLRRLKEICACLLIAANRTYHVSDERLRAFRTLSPEDKVRWVEQLVTFLRLVSLSKAPQSAKLANTIILRRLTNRGVKLHILIGQSWQASPLTTARAPD